jgi:hypothetical protein
MDQPPHEPLTGGPSFHDRPLARDPEEAFSLAQRLDQCITNLDDSAQALSHALLRRMLENDARKPTPQVTPAAREALSLALTANERDLGLAREPLAGGAGPSPLDSGDFDEAAIDQAILKAMEPDGTVNLSAVFDFLQPQANANRPEAQIVLARAYGRALKRLDDETLGQEEAKKRSERHAAGLL